MGDVIDLLAVSEEDDIFDKTYGEFEFSATRSEEIPDSWNFQIWHAPTSTVIKRGRTADPAAAFRWHVKHGFKGRRSAW